MTLIYVTKNRDTNFDNNLYMKVKSQPSLPQQRYVSTFVRTVRKHSENTVRAQTQKTPREHSKNTKNTWENIQRTLRDHQEDTERMNERASKNRAITGQTQNTHFTHSTCGLYLRPQSYCRISHKVFFWKTPGSPGGSEVSGGCIYEWQ